MKNGEWKTAYERRVARNGKCSEDEDATYVGCGNLFLSVFCSDNYVFSILSDAGCRSEF
mgnify:CR=1 FL=1